MSLSRFDVQIFLQARLGFFGSFSGSTFTGKSDIDILIEIEKLTGWKFFPFEISLKKVFSPNIDLVIRDVIKERTMEQILKRVKYV